MEILLILGVVIIILFALNAFLDRLLSGRKASDKAVYNYRRKEHLMTRSEREFFQLLAASVGERYHVFPQVHLSAIVDHAIKGQNWKAAFRHINGKSVDYVLCDKASLRPLAAIELDDWTHNHDHRKERDVEVERILAQAKLPLVRFNGYKNLSKDDIAQQITDAIKA